MLGEEPKENISLALPPLPEEGEKASSETIDKYAL